MLLFPQNGNFKKAEWFKPVKDYLNLLEKYNPT